MNPIATACQSADQAMGASSSPRSITRQRIIRSGKVHVAMTTTNRRRGTLTVRSAAPKSAQFTPLTAHHRHARVIASPRSQAQEAGRLGGVEGEVDKIADFIDERAQLLA